MLWSRRSEPLDWCCCCAWTVRKAGADMVRSCNNRVGNNVCHDQLAHQDIKNSSGSAGAADNLGSRVGLQSRRSLVDLKAARRPGRSAYQNDPSRRAIEMFGNCTKAGSASTLNEEMKGSRRLGSEPVQVGYRRRSGRHGRVVGAAESDPKETFNPRLIGSAGLYSCLTQRTRLRRALCPIFFCPLSAGALQKNHFSL